MTSSRQSTKLFQPWLADLKAGYNNNLTSRPNYYLHSPAASLITTSNIHSLHLGTGESIYESLIPLLESANEELILVTCFWATSATQKLVNAALRTLSEKGKRQGNLIRVRICFSSSSIFQKLFHPQTLAGKVYPPSTWQSTLQLPDSDELTGLDMQVKSIFLLPFSVMHPKFIIVDRKIAVLPSCNVSWEDWFEGAVTLTGGVVSRFVDFWREFWARGDDRDESLAITTLEPQRANATTDHQRNNLPLHKALEIKDIQTIFLPSPHTRNPSFRFLPWQDPAPAPPTPLNTFFLRCLLCAERQIYIQTPNLTAAPVLSALLETLARGVDIHIVTSERLMILEQLVTAGTTTSRCIDTLVTRYHQLCSSSPSDLETGSPRPGKLRIEYFTPGRGRGSKEPQQSHLKCTIVDEELVILGSGNLDRASWFTSQELGVAFLDGRFAGEVRAMLEVALEGRVRRVL